MTADARVTGTGTSWQQVHEREIAGLIRSENLEKQFRQAVDGLQKKADDLEAESTKLSTKIRADDACASLDAEISALRAEVRDVEQREEELAGAARTESAAFNASVAQEKDCAEAAAAVRAGYDACRAAAEEAKMRAASALAECRSLVSTQALDRFTAEATELRSQLVEQEAETLNLRQALADSWAAREDEPAETSNDSGSIQVSLEHMEEELTWLAQMQQSASAEARNLQKLERTEAALHAELRDISEEKAALQSARVDLGDTGKAMREAIAFQSEGYVKRVDDLEVARRIADSDRTKLLQECADLQAKLDAMLPELSSAEELETRHASADAEYRALTREGERLRLINSALTAQLLADSAPPGGGGLDASAVTEAIVRVMQTQLRLVERLEAHGTERTKLAERLRQLELHNASGRSDVSPDVPTVGLNEIQGSRPAPVAPSTVTSASSALKRGFGKLRDIALPPR